MSNRWVLINLGHVRPPVEVRGVFTYFPNDLTQAWTKFLSVQVTSEKDKPPKCMYDKWLLKVGKKEKRALLSHNFTVAYFGVGICVVWEILLRESRWLGMIVFQKLVYATITLRADE